MKTFLHKFVVFGVVIACFASGICTWVPPKESSVRQTPQTKCTAERRQRGQRSVSMSHAASCCHKEGALVHLHTHAVCDCVCVCVRDNPSIYTNLSKI
ncbi:hypothetical protein GN956_G2565 [Arapaima gigas]